LQLFRDPRFLQQQIVFIDALNDQEYAEGHIPGAFRFDPYNPAKFADYMSEVLPVCEAAEQVVVYCNGGDCDASELAVQYLASAGVSIQKLFIYVGGITEWKSKSLPVEIGARNSGSLRNTSP
jgi:rhodanese-related sulfurtransferase